MTYKLINNQIKEEHLCDKVTIDGFDYYLSDEIIEKGWEGIAYKNDVKGKIFKHFYTTNEWYKDAKKVIATNNPNIDIPKAVDKVEEITKDEGYSNSFRIGFKHGYNKSQESHPFSEEDMKSFATHFYTRRLQDIEETIDQSLQLWKEQQLKVLFYQ